MRNDEYTWKAYSGGLFLCESEGEVLMGTSPSVGARYVSMGISSSWSEREKTNTNRGIAENVQEWWNS